jgi:hypothetical protein
MRARPVQWATTRASAPGDQHDLRIALAGGEQIRAVGPAAADYQQGEEVTVELPVEACRLLRP